MKRVVCREDIQAEMDIFHDMQYKIQMLEGQLSMLQDRINLLEAKSSVVSSTNTSVSTSVNIPTRTGDTPYSYWGEAISNAAERIQQDGHFDINDDGTITYVRN